MHGKANPDWVISKVMQKISDGVSNYFQGRYFDVDEDIKMESPIYLFTFTFREVSPRYRLLSTPDRDQQRETRNLLVANMVFGSNPNKIVSAILMIDSWCQKHTRKYSRFLFPLSKMPSPMDHGFLLCDHLVPLRDFEGRRVQAAIVNSISLSSRGVQRKLIG